MARTVLRGALCVLLPAVVLLAACESRKAIPPDVEAFPQPDFPPQPPPKPPV